MINSNFTSLRLILLLFFILLLAPSYGLNAKFDFILRDSISKDTFRYYQKVKDANLNKKVRYEKTNSEILLRTDLEIVRTLILSDTVLTLSNNKPKNDDYFFYEYSLKDKNLITKYIRFGQKNEQVISGFSSGIVGNSIFIQDVILNKLLIHNTIDKVSREVNFEDIGFSLGVSIDNKLIITGALNSNFKYLVYNLNDFTNQASFGNYGDNKSDKLINAYRQAYQGFLFINPNGSKFINAYRFSDYIEIVDFDKSISTIISGPIGFSPDFIPEMQSGLSIMNRTDKTRFGYVNGYVTTDYIFLIYSGENHQTQYKNQGKYIHVYNWDGQLVRLIELKEYISSLCYDLNQSKIYFFEPKSRQVKFFNF